jgi:hypothetical protein
LGLRPWNTREAFQTDGVQPQRQQLAQGIAGERPERDRAGAEHVGGSPPFQRRDIFLPAEKQQHGSQHCRNHCGNEIKRGCIERHGPPRNCDAGYPARLKNEWRVNTIPNATIAALAIRLHASASFQEKLHQLVGSSSTKKAPEGAFHECRIRGNL